MKEAQLTKLIDDALDKEATRWQERIADTIKRNGLEPFDASGNESGDPLDYTNDQVHHALMELTERLEEARGRGCFACRIEAEIGTEEAPHPVPERFHNCPPLRVTDLPRKP